MKVHFSQMTNDLNLSPTPSSRKASEQRGEHTGWPYERTPHSGPPPGALRSDSRFLVFKWSPRGPEASLQGAYQAEQAILFPLDFSQNPASGPVHARGVGDDRVPHKETTAIAIHFET